MITNPLAIIAFLLGTIFLVPMVCHKIRIPSIVGFILVGIIAGGYSSVCVTGPLWNLMNGKKDARVAAAAAEEKKQKKNKK